MTSSSSKDPARSSPELDYAPPWVRDRARPSTDTIATTETAADTDANTEAVARLQTGGANTLPIVRDELQTRKARYRGAAGRRQGSREIGVNKKTPTNLSVVAAIGSASKKYRLWPVSAIAVFLVLSGVVGFLLGTTVVTSMRRTANEATSSPTAAQLITADSENDPSQTTGPVVATLSDEPTSKPAEPARTPEGASPATEPRSLPSQVPSGQAPTASDNLTLQPIKMPRDPGDATPDSRPQARLSQVPGAQASTAPLPAATEELLRALLSTAPPLEPKLRPSAESTQTAVGQDGSQQSASEVASPPAVEASASSESQRPPLQERSAARRLNSDEITALISRGGDFLKIGDFSAARILLRRAAESGSADAALMLGKTFDPLFLHEIGAIGIKPDVAQCRQWYQKAVELGSAAAAQRLANLLQTGQ
jgi:hypothetical protein